MCVLAQAKQDADPDPSFPEVLRALRRDFPPFDAVAAVSAPGLPYLAEIPSLDASVPVVTNVTAAPERAAAVLRDGLKRQMTAPVLWTQTMRRMVEDGIQTFVEIGPGKVLSGLARRVDRNLELLRVEDVASLERTVERLGGAA